MYRIKEYNSAYDEYFGEGKGWIYITNPIPYASALALAHIHTQKTGRTTELVYCGYELEA